MLGGRDLQRESQGTWLGITKQGRLALLTNFKDEDDPAVEQRSRGEIAKTYLCVPPDSNETSRDFAKRLVEKEGVQGVGGFSLIFGQLRKDRSTGLRAPLGVISNRTPDAEGVKWVAGEGDETQAWTCSLSNSRYGTNAWPKVVKAEKLLDEAIQQSVKANESHDELVNRFFELLRTDDLPRPKPGQSWKEFSYELRNSIFIPAYATQDEDPTKPAEHPAKLERESENLHRGSYGTQKQTVILVDHEGEVTFTERTLFDDNARYLGPEGKDVRFNFSIDGWSSQK